MIDNDHPNDAERQYYSDLLGLQVDPEEINDLDPLLSIGWAEMSLW